MFGFPTLGRVVSFSPRARTMDPEQPPPAGSQPPPVFTASGRSFPSTAAEHPAPGIPLLERTFGGTEEEIATFMESLDEFTPTIPDALTNHYLKMCGVPEPDVRITRLISLAAQKVRASRRLARSRRDALESNRTRSREFARPRAPLARQPRSLARAPSRRAERPNRTHPNPSCAPHPARRSSSPKSLRTRRRARRNVAR